jgi:hypothetical protein
MTFRIENGELISTVARGDIGTRSKSNLNFTLRLDYNGCVRGTRTRTSHSLAIPGICSSSLSIRCGPRP